jgi:hypothetical protein
MIIWIERNTVIAIMVGFIIFFLYQLFMPVNWLLNDWSGYSISYILLFLAIFYLDKSLQKGVLKNQLLFVFVFSISCGFLNFFLTPDSGLVTIKQILFQVTTYNLLLPFGLLTLLLFPFSSSDECRIKKG